MYLTDTSVSSSVSVAAAHQTQADWLSFEVVRPFDRSCKLGMHMSTVDGTIPE